MGLVSSKPCLLLFQHSPITVRYKSCPVELSELILCPETNFGSVDIHCSTNFHLVKHRAYEQFVNIIRDGSLGVMIRKQGNKSVLQTP